MIGQIFRDIEKLDSVEMIDIEELVQDGSSGIWLVGLGI